MPQTALFPGVHMATVRDDVVVLDVRSDRYSCLVGAAELLSFPRPGAVAADLDVLRQLEAAGLAGETAAAQDRRAPLSPTGEIPAGRPRGPLSLVDTAVRSLVTTAQFRRRTLAQLTAPEGRSPGPPTPQDRSRIADRASAYRAVLPFLPFEGLCLQRAYQLRRILASDGLKADWVFGVRTWPFFAHCWLQLDDLVIGDRLERVRAFTPIAVF